MTTILICYRHIGVFLLLTTIHVPPWTGLSFEYIREILDPQNGGKFLEELSYYLFLKTKSASLSLTVIQQRSRTANTHEIRFCFITNDLQLTDQMTKKSSRACISLRGILEIIWTARHVKRKMYSVLEEETLNLMSVWPCVIDAII